ncbi:MAG: hypothetical protein M1814_004280 [Vezdaea aestivalis]|nr:MAG: hypothetical protein M1814_004280 [Vezdaea aestivalis]
MASTQPKDQLPNRTIQHEPVNSHEDKLPVPSGVPDIGRRTPETLDPSTLPPVKTFLKDNGEEDGDDKSDVSSEGSAVIVDRSSGDHTTTSQEDPSKLQTISKGKGKASSLDARIDPDELGEALLDNEKHLPELPSDDPTARPSSRRLSKPHDQQIARSSSYSGLPWPFSSSNGVSKSGSKPTDTHKLKVAIRKRDFEIEALQDKLQSVSEQYAKLHDRHRNLESDFRIAQAGAFRSMQKAQWAAEDDSWVSGHFAKLESYLKSWSRDYAIDKLSTMHLLDQADRGFIESLIRTVCQYGTERFLPPMPAKLDKKAASYILLALLTDFVFRNIIGDPFFFLEDHEKAAEGDQADPSTIFGIKQRLSARQNLNGIYNTISKVNAKDASDWRFQTLRLLDPPVTTEPSRDNALKLRIKALRKETSQRFALLFRSSAAGTLLRRMEKDDTEKCFKELGQLFSYAGELSFRLWTQRTEMKVLGLTELKDRRFAIRSDLLEAHALHKLDDDEDESLDGCPIMAVISPAVVAFGNSDGSDGGRGKILIKATVWLDETWMIQ